MNVIIPRHDEINERTAVGIYGRCAVKLGRDWCKK